jgi:hypothetical protein
MVPVGSAGIDAAEQTGSAFVQAVFPALLHQLPL